MNSKRKVKQNAKTNVHQQTKKPKKVFDNTAVLEEERLTKLLFGGNEELIENLNDDDGILLSKITDLNEDESEPPKRKAVWVDDEDEATTVGNALDVQGRRLPDGGFNARSIKYSTHLKHKFTAIHGTAKWADLDRQVEENSDDEILKTVGHLAKHSGKILPKKTLEFKKLNNLNKETLSEGPIVTCTRFHPTSSVALVAGVSGVVSLFAVDGRSNDKLHSLAFQRYPIQCARFSKDGNEAILGGVHKYFHSYDLISGETIKIPLPHDVTHMKRFEISPCGKIIAIAGRFGEIHLLTGSSKELITTLKQNSECTALVFSADSSKLYSHGKESEITVWDLDSRKVYHKFIDEGCVNGSSIAVSPSGQYLAAGSAQGVVNIYNILDSLSSGFPKPVKTIMNLRTAITSLEFNSASEMLSMVSGDTEDAIRLVHFPSATVFSNFPGFLSKLGRPLVATFSPGSGYLAVSNNRSTVSLYRIKHYKNY